jgi:hypothetical protein
MDVKKSIMLFGIVLILGFLGLYFVFKSPFDIFNITLGVLVLIFGFYTKGKKIEVSLSYFVATFSVNVTQWLILIYTFYYNPGYITREFYIALLIALWVTLFIINQIRKEYFKSSENIEKISNIFKDTKKLILLSTGIIMIISSLAGLINYHALIFAYGTTVGLTVFVYGFYHKNRKLNISVRYVEAMAFTIVLQWIILIYFCFQFAAEDWSLASTFSMLIAVFFLVQFYQSDVTLSDLILD